MRATALLLLVCATRTQSTTLAAARCATGVALAADSRATEGTVIADSKCDKLHELAENVYAAGCGGAADADDVARLVALELRTEHLRRTMSSAAPTKNRGRVAAAKSGIVARLRSAPLGCAFLIGGCGFDDEGPALYRVEGDGSAAESQFATMGSSARGRSPSCRVVTSACARIAANAYRSVRSAANLRGSSGSIPKDTLPRSSTE